MSRNRKKAERKRSAAGKPTLAMENALRAVVPKLLDARASYTDACQLASQGQRDEARRLYADMQAAKGGAEPDARLRALVHNDLAVMAVMEGRFDQARAEWRAALETDRDCLLARLNRDLVEAEIGLLQPADGIGELKLAPAPCLPVGAPPSDGGH